MDQFHKVNELYDGTLNKIQHFFYSTYITKDETFTFHEATKQEDIRSLINAMEKEIHDHEKGGY